ncbi:Metallo-hydrolase/oxidoreductase [Lentinus tigrinus ALCF2SS1-7]|uniref:Metallo-hydrolase/oxidoreductase n=1 Tax=Lentinus tigrinus ALCF2SS1-7 TaxID=1328758 RepID=UPI00116602C9|nr:Metallo-hydrolase/oxidoreductase [Lentinus tigrinus ALCF2SS1-7]
MFRLASRTSSVRASGTHVRPRSVHTHAVPPRGVLPSLVRNTPGPFPAASGSASPTSARGIASLSRASINKIPPAEPWRRHPSSDPETPNVFTFFEKATSTWQYIVVDPHTSEAVIIDSVLDYDPASGVISTATADGLVSFVEQNGLKVIKILETHAHADHLTAAQYLKQQLGGDVPVCIGQRIKQVQETFAPIYGLELSSMDNAFDAYLKDNEEFNLGSLSCHVLHLPGHTPDHVGFVIGKAVFTGDSIFNPDVGTARADFPGGNAETLYASMQRLLSLPGEYRLYVGHDYPQNRDQTCFSTVADQRAENKHVKEGTDATSFIQWRKDRDAVLGAPRLLHPSLQVNIRAGRLPPADEQGRVFLRTPVKFDAGVKL